MALSVTIVHKDGANALLALGGSLDRSSSSWLEGALASLIVQHVTVIAVDVRELDFCDVEGARLLARFQSLLRGDGGDLEIVGPGPAIRLLELLWPELFGAAPEAPPSPVPRHHPGWRRLGLPRARVRPAVMSRKRILLRAEALRAVAAEQLDLMRVQQAATCSGVAEMHERLAGLHERLGGALPCDGESHHGWAEEFRRRGAEFTPR
ncbi:STAS domain-containing protein [Nonomuraea sp. NPDC003727]